MEMHYIVLDFRKWTDFFHLKFAQWEHTKKSKEKKSKNSRFHNYTSKIVGGNVWYGASAGKNSISGTLDTRFQLDSYLGPRGGSLALTGSRPPLRASLVVLLRAKTRGPQASRKIYYSALKSQYHHPIDHETLTHHNKRISLPSLNIFYFIKPLYS